MAGSPQRAIVANWTPDTWAWQPDMGRWTPAYDMPHRPVHIALSTTGIAPHEAFDFWRENALYQFEPDPPPTTGFNAHVQGIIAAQAEFFAYVSDPLSGKRSARQQRSDDGDDIDIGFVEAGRRCHDPSADAAITSTAGHLYYHDAARPGQVLWSGHRGMHLKLRRTAVKTVLGGRIPAPSDITAALRNAPLAATLRDQFRLLTRHMGQLETGERQFLLAQTEQLALFALTRALQQHRVEQPATRTALFAAAQRHIDRHLADPALQADSVAHALYCARATLYRAFAEHGTSVAASIREQRLACARRLLCNAPQRAIGDIAACCGFTEPRSFHRAFRARYGQTPGDLRRQWLQEHLLLTRAAPTNRPE